MIALQATHPEDRDFAVNGPLWNSHVIPTVNESAREVEDRRRVIQQASRRVKRSVEDQALILALQNQLDREHDKADAKSNELANFHEGAQDIRRM